MAKPEVPQPKTKFIKVKCGSCGNEQAIFSSPSSKPRCLVCEQVLAFPKASKLGLAGKTKVVKELQ